jgi:hypothetical protein
MTAVGVRVSHCEDHSAVKLGDLNRFVLGFDEKLECWSEDGLVLFVLQQPGVHSLAIDWQPVSGPSCGRNRGPGLDGLGLQHHRGAEPARLWAAFKATKPGFWGWHRGGL